MGPASLVAATGMQRQIWDPFGEAIIDGGTALEVWMTSDFSEAEIFRRGDCLDGRTDREE